MNELHNTLKKYRVLAIATGVFFGWLAADMWFWFQANHGNLSPSSAGAFGSMSLLCMGAVKFILETAMQRHEKDDD